MRKALVTLKEVKITRKLATGRKRALQIAGFVSTKKAKDIVILDIGKSSGVCDYFVICSADSKPQVKAIYDETLRMCKKNKIDIQHREHDESLRWILVDFFDVMLHIFLDEAREFYNLEYLWNTAKKIKLGKDLVEKS